MSETEKLMDEARKKRAKPFFEKLEKVEQDRVEVEKQKVEDERKKRELFGR